MNDFTYLNQTALGEIFGVSSHKVGKWLKELGYRTEDGKPSAKAFAYGYVRQEPTGRAPGTYYYVWNADKTITVLEFAGHFQVCDQKQ